MKEPNATLSLFLGTSCFFLPSAFSSGRTSPMITFRWFCHCILFIFIFHTLWLDIGCRAPFCPRLSLGTNSPPVIKPYITELLEYLEEGTLTHDSIILQYLPAKVNPMAALHVLQWWILARKAGEGRERAGCTKYALKQTCVKALSNSLKQKTARTTFPFVTARNSITRKSVSQFTFTRYCTNFFALDSCFLHLAFVSFPI